MLGCMGYMLVEVLVYVHRNRRFIRGTGAQDDHLEFHTAPELCMVYTEFAPKRQQFHVAPAT